MKIEKIQKKVDKITSGNFCDSDIGMLLVWLRPVLVNKDETLLDIANFVTHGDGRDRGMSFDLVDKHVDNFLKVSDSGGNIYGLPAVFKKDDIIKRLCDILRLVSVQFDEKKLVEQKESVILAIMDLMEESEFKINDPRIKSCSVVRRGQSMLLSIQAELKGGIIQMSGGARFETSFFG